jgi:hypothetical protein
VAKIRGCFERSVVSRVIGAGDPEGILGRVKNFQVLAAGIVLVAETKTLWVYIDDDLADL